jgi:hypothetical protein
MWKRSSYRHAMAANLPPSERIVCPLGSPLLAEGRRWTEKTVTAFEITAVGTEPAGNALHDHITDVQVGDSITLSYATVVADLRSADGDRYYTYRGGLYADVVVVSCPHCQFGDYLATASRDAATTNSLLDLPRI